MHQPYEKFIRIELIAILIAVIVGIFALIKGFLLLILFTFYLLAFSIASAALVEWYTRQQMQAGKHLIQAILLFIFTTYLLFHL